MDLTFERLGFGFRAFFGVVGSLNGVFGYLGTWILGYLDTWI